MNGKGTTFDHFLLAAAFLFVAGLTGGKQASSLPAAGAAHHLQRFRLAWSGLKTSIPNIHRPFGAFDPEHASRKRCKGRARRMDLEEPGG